MFSIAMRGYKVQHNCEKESFVFTIAQESLSYICKCWKENALGFFFFFFLIYIYFPKGINTSERES